MYDVPYIDELNLCIVSLKTLATIYLTADKYQVESLKKTVHQKIKEHIHLWSLFVPQDFLDAVKVIIIGTSLEDKDARATMINACVNHIQELQKLSGFSALLREHGDIGAEIIHHTRLPLMLEGTWYCGDKIRHPDAVPSCRRCEESFPESYVRSHRHRKAWKCPECRHLEQPVCYCLECGDDCMSVKWQWYEE